MNPRSAQILTASLAGLLVILVGATVFVLLSRPTSVGPSPTPASTASPVAVVSPTPTLVASVSPSESVPPTVLITPTPAPSVTESPSPTPTSTPTESPSPTESESPSPSPTESPTPSPTPTESPSPTPTPEPTATPSPTPTPTPIVPTAPQRQVRVLGIGLDMAGAENESPRYISVNVDGPSVITARVFEVSSGTVRACLTREDSQEPSFCNKGNGLVTVTVTDASSVWTVSLKSRDKNNAPTASVSIDFNANEPTATLSSFRYAGTQDPARNGFVVEVDSLADARIQVQGGFEDNQQNFRLIIKPTDGDPIHDESGGPATSFSAEERIAADTSYQVTLSSPDEVATNAPTSFVQASISWAAPRH